MKIKVLILLIIFAVAAVSCDSGNKFSNSGVKNGESQIPDETESEEEEITENSDDSSDNIAEEEVLNGSDETEVVPEPDDESAEPDGGIGDLTDDSDDATDENDSSKQHDIKVGEKRFKECENLPENAQWNAVSGISQTWNGAEWIPSDKSEYNLERSEKECRFKCRKNYTWNEADSTCDANRQDADCLSKPENTVWNDNGKNGKFTQTWNGAEWMPPVYAAAHNQTAGECRFKCNTNYTWNGTKCEADTQYGICTGKPVNTKWNDEGAEGKYLQTWTGSAWEPSGIVSEHNTTSGVCHYKCNTNYTWNNTTQKCDADTRQTNCPAKPANSVWNDGGKNGKFTQTWTGSAWDPSGYAATFSKNAGICTYDCDANFSYNLSTSQCDGATQQAACSSKPANTVWNDNGRDGKFTQTWNGSVYAPETYASNYGETAGVCIYKCANTYHRENGQCVSDTKTNVSCTDLPANAEWNTASSITQTWTGAGWTPSNTGSFSASASTNECKYKCKTNYNWNSSGKTCDAATQDGTCSSKPANTVWNDGGKNGKFTQTWTGSAWTPASYSSTYSTTPGECSYQCAGTYHRENGSCVSDTKTNVSCIDLPANAEWNTASSITQTWTGSSWTPSNTGSFSASASTNECKYKCKTNYNWNSSGKTCDAATQNGTCSSKPANTVWNDGGKNGKFTQTWNGSAWSPASYDSSYNTSAGTCRYKCADNYHYENGSCVYNIKSNVSCTGLPANAQWNTASAITQTWNGASYQPTNVGSYNETANSNECRYKCKSSYHTENGGTTCVSDTKTGVACTGLIANAEWWNGASTFTQTWNGSSWTPSAAGSYSTSAGTCRYKCKDGFHTENNGVTCISDTKTGVACTGLPANAEWNTVSSITQTWNGTSYQPSSVGTHNKTASQAECHYKCKTNYTYQTSNSTCKADSKVSNCTGLIANAVWNTVSTISQTWNGSSWQPSTAGTYNMTASDKECRYKCDSTHYWYNSECKNPCDSSPCANLANSTKVCTATSANNYSCGCNRYYQWNGSSCASIPNCSKTSSTPCRLSTTIWSSQSSYTMNWDSAVSYCNSLTEGGNDDWKLPNISQLRTLVQNCSGTVTNGSCKVTSSCTSTSCYSDNCYCRPDSTGGNSKFGSTNELWSSTAISDKSGYVWSLQYSRAQTIQAAKSNSNYVRCVR